MKSQIKSALRKAYRFRFMETMLSDHISKRAGKPVEQRVHNSCERLRGGGANSPVYIIRRHNDWGLLSIISMYLRYIDYALRRNWVPVVDMESIHSLYLDDADLNKGTNAWEYFFEQPCKVSLTQARKSSSIIYPSYLLNLINDLSISWDFLNDETKLAYWQSLAREHLRFSSPCEQYIDKMRSTTFGSSPHDSQSKTLGIYCRGTDYLSMRPSGHPIQPTPRQAIDKAREVLARRELESIYLVTEDENVLKEFSAAFPERLLYADVKRYGTNGKYIWQEKEMLNRSRRLNGLEYLASIQLLAECDSFIGGVTGGTTGMMLLRNGKFGYQYFYDLGRYE